MVWFAFSVMFLMEGFFRHFLLWFFFCMWSHPPLSGWCLRISFYFLLLSILLLRLFCLWWRWFCIYPWVCGLVDIDTVWLMSCWRTIPVFGGWVSIVFATSLYCFACSSLPPSAERDVFTPDLHFRFSRRFICNHAFAYTNMRHSGVFKEWRYSLRLWTSHSHFNRRGHNSPAVLEAALEQRSSPLNSPQKIKEYNISSPSRSNYLSSLCIVLLREIYLICK